MNILLIDANAYSLFRRGQDNLAELFEEAPGLAMNSIVLGELYSGFAMGSREAMNRHQLKEFLDESAVQLIPVRETTATHYATVLSSLRRVGRIIPTNDLWIAASALEYQFDLCSFDAHFQGIAGLRMGTKLSDFEL